MLRALLLALALCQPTAAVAGTLDLEGSLTQGGLVFGTATPGTELSLDGQAVRIAPDGRFVIGFGRDHGPEATLEARFPDGEVTRRPLAIAKRDYQIQRIDGLPSNMVTPPEDVLARIREEAARVAAARAVDRAEALFESGFFWPVEGIVTGIYGSQRILNGEPRRPHFGIDIAAPEGTPVTAPADGVIALAETDLYFTGGTLIIDHGHGLSSALLHMKELWVAPGERVTKGQAVGSVGSTGRSTGPHLDWRINWFKERLDPALLVPPMPAPKEGTATAD